MSRRKKTKLTHVPLHHYPPLLLSPLVHDDQQHHSLPSYPTPNSVTPLPPHSQTPPAKPSSSLSLVHSLSRDPYLLPEDEWPDLDSLLARAALPDPSPPQLQSPPSAPAVQRALSYQSSPVVRTISIPSPLDGLDDYPSLRDVLVLEEDEEEVRRREALEREMAQPLSELLDDAEEEEEEWERRRQRSRERRRQEEQRSAEPVSDAHTDGALLTPPSSSTIPSSLQSRAGTATGADEFAATQVVQRSAEADWTDSTSSQSQTQRSVSPTTPHTSSLHVAGIGGRASLPSASSSPPFKGEQLSGAVDADENGDMERTVPAHRFSRRICLSNGSSVASTPVTQA